MSFICIILALIILKFTKASQVMQNYTWFDAYRSRFVAKLSDWKEFPTWLVDIITIAIPSLLLWLLIISFADDAQQFVYLVVGVLVLLHCMGPMQDFKSLQSLSDALEQDDDESTNEYAEKLGISMGDNNNKMCEKVLSYAYNYTAFGFIALFVWLVILGPTGALFYFLLKYVRQYPLDHDKACEDEQTEGELLAEHAESMVAVSEQKQEQEQKQQQDTENTEWSDEHVECDRLAQLRHLLDWIPARIAAFAFALAGDFVHAWGTVNNRWWHFDVANTELVEHAGLGAQRIHEQEHKHCAHDVKEALQFCERTLVVILVLISILLVLGFVH